MTEPTRIYQKFNSFVEMSHAETEDAQALLRIDSLYSKLGELNFDESKKDVIEKACNALLKPQEASDNPRFKLESYITQEILHQNEEDLPRYLYYRYRYETNFQNFIIDEFPPSVQVEVSSICNYRCVFCYQTDSALTSPKNEHMGLMSVDLFKQVIDELEGNCDQVTIASRGEPLINRNISEMLAYTEGKFVAFKINTNAWFLDEKKSHAILESGVNNLVFSVDAATEPLYSQLRVNGNLERVVKNIRLFQDIRKKHYPNSKILTRASGVKVSTEQSFEEMEGFWGDLVDQVAFVDYNPWENTYERPINDISQPCSDLWRRTFVWFNGFVNPCDVDYRSFLTTGNIKNASLAEIWSGEKYSQLRDAHLNNRRSEQSPCNRCTLV